MGPGRIRWLVLQRSGTTDFPLQSRRESDCQMSELSLTIEILIMGLTVNSDGNAASGMKRQAVPYILLYKLT